MFLLAFSVPPNFLFLVRKSCRSIATQPESATQTFMTLVLASFLQERERRIHLALPVPSFPRSQRRTIPLVLLLFYLQDISSGAWQNSLFLPDAGFFVIHIHPQLELCVQFPAQTASQFWVAEMTISSKEWWLCALRDLQHIRRRMPFVDAEHTHSTKNSLREASVHHPKPTRLFSCTFRKALVKSTTEVTAPWSNHMPHLVLTSFQRVSGTPILHFHTEFDSKNMFTAISPVLSFFFHLPSAKASTWLPVSHVWACLPPSAQLAELLFVSF